MPVHGEGPTPARVMLVGQAPGPQEEAARRPFAGYSGMLLESLLIEAGMPRSTVYLTNVARERPPQDKIGYFFLNNRNGELTKPAKGRAKPIWQPGPHITSGLEILRQEVERVNPDILVPMGDIALWALEGNQQIGKWRGSILTSKPEFGNRKLIPTWHPAFILRSFESNPELRADLFRVRQQLDYPFGMDKPWRRRAIIRPTLAQVREAIWQCYRHRTFACDTETRAGEMSCLGLAWNLFEGICIPFMDSKKPNGAYWTEDEELLVWQWIEWLFRQPDMEPIWQNGSYDASFFIERRGYCPPAKWDTMDMHHVLYAGAPKSLDYMASMYCEWYRYWKDDGKEWDVHLPEEQHWQYNIEDSWYTLELKGILEERLRAKGLLDKYRWRQDTLWPAIMETVLGGIRVDPARLEQHKSALLQYAKETQQQIDFLCGHHLNPRSSHQIKALLIDDFGCRPVIDRKTGSVTTKDEALDKTATAQPLLRPLITRIKDYRSATTLLSQLGIGKEGIENRRLLDTDSRIRFNLNIGGAETYRLSSSKNNRGSGMNGQNITKGDEDEHHDPGRLVAPNIRAIFIPDAGYTLVDIDLKRADLVVVAKEAEDEVLLQQLAEGYNPYLFAAAEYLKCSLEEVEARHGTRYTLMKSFFHLTNYCGTAKTAAATCGMLTGEAERLQRWWFGRHPGISRWHMRTKARLMANHEVVNAFGYRRPYFDRPDKVLSKAVAWIPQSTVAIVTLIQWTRWRTARKASNVLAGTRHLLQVHDSHLFGFPTDSLEAALAAVYPHMVVEIPYPKPLIIYPTLSTSTSSWGEVKKRSWPT